MFLQAMRIFPKIIKIKLFSQGVCNAKNILCKTVLKEYPFLVGICTKTYVFFAKKQKYFYLSLKHYVTILWCTEFIPAFSSRQHTSNARVLHTVKSPN